MFICKYVISVFRFSNILLEKRLQNMQFIKVIYFHLLYLLSSLYIFSTPIVANQSLSDFRQVQQVYKKLNSETEGVKFLESSTNLVKQYKNSIFYDLVILKTVQYLQKQEEHEQAFSYLKLNLQQFRSSSLYSVGLIRLVRIAKYLKKYEEAIDLCDNKKLLPEIKNMLLGDIYCAMEQLEKAVVCWQEALNFTMDDNLIEYLQAKIYNQRFSIEQERQ